MKVNEFSRDFIWCRRKILTYTLIESWRVGKNVVCYVIPKQPPIDLEMLLVDSWLGYRLRMLLAEHRIPVLIELDYFFWWNKENRMGFRIKFVRFEGNLKMWS